MSQTFGPYSPVRQAGDLWYVSGQVGVDPATSQASTDVADQTKQALDNLSDVLKQAGLALDDVVKTTLFVTNIASFSRVNEVYERYFKEPRPARSTVQVAALPRVAGDMPLLIEIEAVAYKEPA